MEKNKILITGVAGFFAGHIAEQALTQGIPVVGIDIVNSESTPREEKERTIRILEQVAEEKQASFRLYRKDIREIDAIKEIFLSERPTLVIHAAALTMDRASIDNALEFIDTNVSGSQSIIEAVMATKSVGQLIAISSRSVIGVAPRASDPMSENALPRPVNPYGATKLAMEALLHSFHADTGVPVTICRMQPMYGPRQRHDMMVWRLFDSILNGTKIEKYGSGEATRDWLYIFDAVEAIFALIGKTRGYDTFNIGTGIPTSTNRLIELCESISGNKANISSGPNRRGDAGFAGVADCTEIHLATGWLAKTKLREGLTQTFQYMKSATKGR